MCCPMCRAAHSAHCWKSRYLNQYEAADEHAKEIAKRLIHPEAQLSADIRRYL